MKRNIQPQPLSDVGWETPTDGPSGDRVTVVVSYPRLYQVPTGRTKSSEGGRKDGGQDTLLSLRWEAILRGG